ncbi:NAD-dependent epimerase/dehydratase family protein [Pelagibacteraceae bacterium]|nr:NAD-dependent epimerase/dehydratase family protein [Pelagibacteraceae bacterium]
MNILVTGCAGFIGYHLCHSLSKNKKYFIIGLDNLNDYYDVDLKKSRISNLSKNKNFFFKKIDINNKLQLKNLFKKFKIKIVVNLAAQAGVRNSIENPDTYFDNNILGFYNILTISKTNKVKHLIFASTSSVYGNTKKFPNKEIDNTDSPVSFYAATKKCNEVIAYSFSSIYKIPITGVRLFTVYGPYGRPDMALFKFVDSIVNKKTIKLFNKGDHIRDFTFVDDVVKYIEKIILKKPTGDIPYQIFNIGSNKPKTLKHFINVIKKNLKLKVKTKDMSFQAGDVFKTHADNAKIKKFVKKEYYTNIEKGIREFINWYKNFYGKNK